MIQDFVKDHKILPPVLFINLDNCGRENKNRYLLAFLSALVELGVFREIVVYFLLVGHTGNAVDRQFSVIAQELKKSEVKTLEELISIIAKSIKPAPKVESLKFTWDWKTYIEAHLASPKLNNHSFYNAFRITKEGSIAKLRLKRLPQDQEWLPPTGIQLIKPNIQYEAVGSSDFRVEHLQLDKILHDLLRYFKRMPTPIRVTVSNSWNRLKEELERTPKMMHNLPPMKITELPRLSPQVPAALPDEFDFVEDTREGLPNIQGNVCEEGLFNENIKVGVDVVVYTKSTVSRPWVGRVAEIFGNLKFSVHWYDRQGKTSKFRAMMKDDNTPYSSVLDNSTVMFWDISVERSHNSFHLTPYWLGKVKKEYAKCDEEQK